MQITKVVIPVAGWGTRSLPATKNIPKEMLPIFKKPVVQYVVEELEKVGMRRLIFVTGPGKVSLQTMTIASALPIPSSRQSARRSARSFFKKDHPFMCGFDA